MRLRVTAAVVAASLTLAACADPKTIDGVTYDTYGLLNEDEKRNEKIEYDVSYGNIFWSIVLFETVIVPIWLVGFELYEPVGKKSDIKGQVAS